MKLQTPHQRVSMPAKPLAFGLGIFLSAGALSLHAASQTWDGGASTNVLNTAANWTNDALPTTALDNATFDGTAAGNLSLIWNAAFGPASGNSGGVNIILAGTQTGSVQLDTAVANSFGLGDVTLNSGAGAFTLGDGSGTANVTLRDATQAFTNNSSNTATIKSDVVIANGGGAGTRTVIFDGSGNWTVEGSFFGSGTYTGATGALISKTGAGTLTLNGANINTGTNSVTGGAIAITHGSALGTGSTNLNGGRLRVSNTITVANAINIFGTSAASSTVGAIENTSGNNTLSGAITWSNTGGLFSNIVSQSGTLTLSGNITTSGSVTGTRTINLGGAGNIIASGIISNGTATLGLSKNGAGTVTLSGLNTYGGGTVINGGTLAVGVNNALPSGTAIDITSGTLDMGAFTSTAASLALSNGATVKFNVSALSPGNVTALLSLSGAFTETLDGGTYNIDFDGFTFNAAGSYKLIDFSSLSGTFLAGDFAASNSTLGSGFTGDFIVNGSSLSYVVASAVPEPSTYAALAGLVVLGLATVRRRKQA